VLPRPEDIARVHDIEKEPNWIEPKKSRQPAAVKPLVIAHRGASSIALENSLAAFRAAGGQGADGVGARCPCHDDGEIVVHHDPSVLGLPIAQARWRDLAAVPLANGEPIPSLAAGARCARYAQSVRRGEAARSPLGRPAPRRARWGPEPERLRGAQFRVRRRAPARAETAVSPPGRALSEVPTRNPKRTLEDASAQTLWQERSTLDEALVKTVHGLGAGIFAWTVDNPGDMERLVRYGVDGICTNHPERARPIVDASRAA